MGATAAIVGGMGLSAAGNIFGAKSQSDTNSQNLQAQLAHQQMMQTYVNGLLQNGQNPYSAAIMRFVGQGMPGSAGATPSYAQQLFGGSSAYPTGGGQSLFDPNAGGPAITGSPYGTNMLPPGMMGQLPTGIQANPSTQQAYATPQTPTPNDNSPYAQYVRAAQTRGASGGAAQYDPEEAVKFNAAYPYYGSAGGWNGTGQMNGTPYNQAQNPAYFLQGGQNIDASGRGLASTDPRYYNALSDAASQNAATGSQGWSPAMLALLQQFPQLAQNAVGLPQDNTLNMLGLSPGGAGGGAGFGGSGGMIGGGFGGGFGGQLPGGVGGGLGGSFGGVGGAPGGIPGAVEGAFNYNPSTLGAAPQIQAPQFQGAGAVQAPVLNAPQINYAPSFSPQMLGGLPQISAPLVTGTQGSNAGQDGLMQLMRSNLKPSTDPSLSLNLQSLGSGNTQFDNTDLFKALAPLDQTALDTQVAALQGSAGSLGHRFGTDMMNQERLMRQNFAESTTARNAGIQQQSFEAAQGRRLPALQTQAGMMQNADQFNLGLLGQQINAAGALQSGGFQNAGLNQQAQLANQSASMQAQGMNLNSALATQQANQSAGLQAGLSGQSLAAQIAQQNAANQLQTGSLNVGSLLQSQLANQGIQQQTGQANLGAYMQAALANQNILGQYGTSNANIMNQASQFNAGQNQGGYQFGVGQGNTVNNMILAAMSQAANLQNQQNAGNAGLVGILGGVGVPQAQPSPWGSTISDIGQQAMLMPFLLSMMGGGGRSGAASYTPQPFQMGNFTPNTLSYY